MAPLPRNEGAVLAPSAPTDRQGDDDDVISRIYLIRHGDRYDYANDHWARSAKEHGTLLTDPPLSALGHCQAKETADYLLDVTRNNVGGGGGGGEGGEDRDGRQGVSKILVSPYLRVIQTACPTSDAFNLPLSIEFGLSEAHATPGNVLPSAKERFAYFPQIDPLHRPHLQIEPTPGHTCRKTGCPCEAFAGRYVQRMGEFAQRLESTYRGETIICFSHAASVALIAAFLKCTMRELKFAPCGVYELQRKGGGAWELVNNGEFNEHVSENSPTTYPWGFGEKHFEEEEGEDGGDDSEKTTKGHYFGSSEGIGLDYFVE